MMEFQRSAWKGFTEKMKQVMTLKKSLFTKLLLSYLITVLIPTVVISSFYLYNYSIEMKDQIHDEAKSKIEILDRSLNLILSNIDKFMVQTSFVSSLDDMLRGPDRVDIYEYNVFKEYLRKQISSNPLFYSIYVSFRLNDKVLTSNEGFYKLSEFYDRAIIEEAKQRGDASTTFKQRQLLVEKQATPVDVLTFNKPIPLTLSEPLGYLTFNIDRNMLFNVLDQVSEGRTTNILVLDDSGQTIYQNGMRTTFEKAISSLDEKELTNEDVIVTVSIEGENYLVSHARMDIQGWTIYQLTPYEEYLTRMSVKVRSTLLVGLTLIVIGFLLSYFFAIMMYSPWKKLLKGISAHFISVNPSMDESSMVKEAIAKLMDEYDNAQTAFQQYEPVIKDRFIYELLHHSTMDAAGLDTRIKHFDLQFDFPYYTALLVNSDIGDLPGSEDENKRVFIFNLIHNIISKSYRSEGTILDNGRFAFIINLPESEWNEEIIRSFKLHSNEINENVQVHLDVTLQFSYGDIVTLVTKVYESFLQAKRMFNYKAVFNKADVVFYGIGQTEQKLEYPYAIQQQLSHAILSANLEGVFLGVERLFDNYIYAGKYPRDRVQDMIVLLLSNVTGALLQEGFDTDVIFRDGNHILKINDCHNQQELKTYILQYFSSAVEVVQSEQDKKSGDLYSLKAIEYMEIRYSENISISHIADHMGISSGYLSKMFKAETGKSPLEYLTDVRMKRGKQLLEDPELSLQKVSEMIGYNDVHSFIRFFKKYEQMTPGEYRKLYC
jgi:two-component system response regulator YesN